MLHAAIATLVETMTKVLVCKDKDCPHEDPSCWQIIEVKD